MRRRIILLTTMATAVAWIGVLHVDGGMVDEVVEPVLRLLVVIGAVAWLVLSVTAPAIETARVWLEIGRAVERRDETNVVQMRRRN